MGLSSQISAHDGQVMTFRHLPPDPGDTENQLWIEIVGIGADYVQHGSVTLFLTATLARRLATECLKLANELDAVDASQP